MGSEHGAHCVGCCWGVMLIMFALGVMSLLWMSVLAAVIFAQKVLPRGDRLAVPLAIVFLVLGTLVALSPHNVPGLADPETHMPSTK